MFFEKIVYDILDNASSLNVARARKDKYYNYVFYGCLWTYTEILKELGHSLDIREFRENDFIFIEQIIFDGKEIFHDGILDGNNVEELFKILN